jgi:hypothetical protein
MGDQGDQGPSVPVGAALTSTVHGTACDPAHLAKYPTVAYSASARALACMSGGSGLSAVRGGCALVLHICPTTFDNINEPDFSELKPHKLFSVLQKSLEQKSISCFICICVYINISLLECENPSFTAVTCIRVEPVRTRPSVMALRNGWHLSRP